MNVCTAKAIHRTEQGIVEIDQDKCVGCGLCAQFCPMDVILSCPETRKAYKCDLCQGKPLCVEACPTGALELVHRENEPGKQGEKGEIING